MRAHRPAGIAVWFVGLTGLACGLAEGDGNRANRDACEAYVAHMNTLTPCMGVTYDVDNICADANKTPVDMVAYYDCMRENASCDGLQPRLDLDGCQQPMQ